MNRLFEILGNRKVTLPEDAMAVLQGCKSLQVFDSVRELAVAAVGGENSIEYQVQYTLPDDKVVTEAIVHKVTNGISANYTDPYMRRRDPDTMLIGDDLPTDKLLFKDHFGYDFDDLRKETISWLQSQDLAVFFYFAGRDHIGSGGIAIAPANAGFFAMGLAMLQQIIPHNELPEDFTIESTIYVAPTFRHTHFNGKQIVVHKRSETLHEIFSYNLYPGPSAKKGLYGALLTKGEKEGWVTAHCSTVQVASPYDNITTFMHEGASGGGKSEMLQGIVREKNGEILVGTNTVNGDRRVIHLPLFCSFYPVTDDMALCHPSLQHTPGKLTVLDAENAWFIRVDSITDYGDDPNLEKLTIKPKEPLLFLNIKSNPGCTALIWDHTEDSPGKPCPNPRVIVPRSIVPNVVNNPVNVDVRSFGVRTPPCTKENPSYGILGLFHVLPPALAWLWRLVAPRGHANPSIVDGGGMGSEGVGSYWPFATGKKIKHANILLEQIIQTPRTRYTLVPNQYIGAWKVGFKPQLLMREYLTRRGNAKLRSEQYQLARCPLLGFEFNYITIEGEKIPTRLLKVYKQAEVETSGYDAGAEILYDFFRKELQQYLTPELNPTGRKIIETCLDTGTMDDYMKLIPMAY
ncbi:MAG: DUF4914 family protein [Chitinophagaceae bacterium]|jgi:hypothetical protein|nr:DUF4914 family protein [Chitinophagaceae bacterium]